jgi:dienelactone hydrolase
LVLLAAVAFLTGCGGTGDVRLTAVPREALVDAPLRVQADGLHGGATLTLTMTGADGKKWTSRAPFEKADATPLLVSVLPPHFRGDPDTVSFPPPDVERIGLSLTKDGRTVATTTVTRRLVDADVRVRAQTLAGPGFIGTFCSSPVKRGPAILVLGGSEGGLAGGFVCRLLASHGYPTLALAYFGLPGLPPALSGIRLEYFARALRWLGRQQGVDPQKVVVMGVSRGGEASLILGSIYPKLVHGVIALVPSSVVNSTTRHPDWTIGGRDVPFTEIPVERINGPVFAVAGGQDQVWPSSIYVENIATRMREHGRKDVTALTYADAGHGVGLAAPNIRVATKGSVHGIYLDLGGTPEADGRARSAMWPRLLAFLSRL